MSNENDNKTSVRVRAVKQTINSTVDSVSEYVQRNIVEASKSGKIQLSPEQLQSVVSVVRLLIKSGYVSTENTLDRELNAALK